MHVKEGYFLRQLSGLLHLPGFPHLHVIRPLEVCGRRASLRTVDVFPVFASEIRLLFAGYRRARRLQNLTLFKTKNVHFATLFKKRDQ